jgi:anti-sigma regulatory factor (Ser/Thr protein kinase)
MQDLFEASKKLRDFISPPYTKIQLPYSFERKTMFAVVDEILHPDLELKSNRVLFDFSRLKFADPTAITVLSNLIEFLRKKGAKIEYLNYQLPSDGNKYLDDCGFFKKYLGEQVFPNSALRQSTLPLQLITHAKSLEWMEHKLTPWIENKVGRTGESFAEIKSCLSEVFNNIRDHSGENVGSVFAQYYPKTKTVMLSISDFGKGIPTNVRKAFPEFSDEKAISKAMEQGFTTKSTPVNQGIGLYYLSKNVVQINGGEIWINSLSGAVRCIASASGVKMLPYKEKFSYPGTLLQLTFNTDKLGSLGAKEEFEW